MIKKFLMNALAVLSITTVRGFVLSKLWLWFIVTTFNIPTINLAQSMGIILIVGMLTKMNFMMIYGREEADEKVDNLIKKDGIWKGLFHIFIAQVLILLIGWGVSQFI